MIGDARRRQFEALAIIDHTYDDAPTGHLTIGLDGVVLRANRAFLAWTGHPGEEVDGVRSLASFLNVGGRIFLETHFWPALRLRGVIDEIAFEVLCRDGTRFPALFSAAMRRDEAGAGLFYRVSIFKSTERRRYEQELLLARQEAERTAQDLARTIGELSRANAALDHSNGELSQFVHAVSHDLQAPLRTVKIFAELLEVRHGGGLGQAAQALLQRMTANLDRMQGLVRDLLDLSQAGRSCHREPVDVGELVLIATQLFEADVLAAEADITCEPLPPVRVERRRIAQLIRNLIANALKYRDPGRPARIHVRAVAEPPMWRFEIRDNGLGFAMSDAERIFEPFKRLHGAEIQGTGLGLALCRNVVAAHGGRIWAESTPGEGSTFCFTLPVDLG